jgi:hypothetical protein
MILEKQTDALVYENGEVEESIGMSLDLDSAQILMQMLSKNLYSDAIGSTIRECASNALDSHRRIGKGDTPIIVGLTATDQGGFEFSVEDFGIGLDSDDVKNIISKYGKSTKRNSATELGMMGLGFKAPLAYTSSFYFVCRKDGIERKYMMYEGEDVNTIDLMYEQSTQEPNGVKVIVPISYKDKWEFIKKIKEQLAYFENVYFSVEDVDNDFSIYRHEKFQFSGLAYDKNLHICLDNVYYPIDFDKLGISSINIPIALRFSLTDGIFPTPNRESIRYTQEAKDKICQRIVEIADVLVSKYNESLVEAEDFMTVMQHLKGEDKMVVLTTMEVSVNIRNLVSYSNIILATPTLKGFSLINIDTLYRNKDYIFSNYSKTHIVSSKTIRENKGWKDLSFWDVEDRKMFIASHTISGIKKEYIKSLVAAGGRWNEKYIVKKKHKPVPLFKKDDYTCYYNMLKLKDYPKSQWRAVITEFQTILQSMIDKYFINIDTLDVPQDFIDSKAKIKALKTGVVKKDKRKRLQGEIVCKVACGLEKWVDGKNCKWVSESFDMSKFYTRKRLMVYGEAKDTETMDFWFKPLKSVVDFATFSERELKKVKDLEIHNLITMEEFMKGKDKPFQRLVTFCLIDKLMDECDSLFKHREYIKDISTNLYDKLEILHAYRRTNNVNIDDSVRKTIIEKGIELSAFDTTVYSEYVSVKAMCDKFPFLEVLMEGLRSYSKLENTIIIKSIIDLLKYNKHRIDWKNYKITLNEDVPLEQVLTQDTIEELVNN